MLDVLIPVSRLLLRLADEDAPLPALCAQLTAEAHRNMLATRDMIATKGRASLPRRARARATSTPARKTCEVAIAAVCDTAHCEGDRMKKFINDVDSMLRESLSGMVEAHPQLLRVEFEPTFVARARARGEQGGADLRRRLGPRAAACRLRRPRHARRGLPGPGVHLARRPTRCWPRRGRGRHGPGRAVHRQELRRRHA